MKTFKQQIVSGRIMGGAIGIRSGISDAKVIRGHLASTPSGATIGPGFCV